MRIAIVTLAGTPNAMVVTRLPPSVELLAAPGAQHALDPALTEAAPVLRALHGVGVGEPLRRRRAHARDDRDEGPDRAAAQHQRPVGERVAHALPHAAETAHLHGGDARARDGQVDHLGDREEADGDRHEPDPVPEKELTERIALDPRHRGEPDRGQPEPEEARHEAFEDGLAAERSHERDPEQGQHEKFRRAEREHERPHDGNGQGQHEGAEHGAEQRRHDGGAERAPGLAVLGHRVAVHDRRRSGRLAGDAEQDRGDVAGGVGDGRHAQQERERFHRVHLEHERQHDRERGRPAEPGQDADDEAEPDADQHEPECRPAEDLDQPAQRRVEVFDYLRMPSTITAAP